MKAQARIIYPRHYMPDDVGFCGGCSSHVDSLYSYGKDDHDEVGLCATCFMEILVDNKGSTHDVAIDDVVKVSTGDGETSTAKIVTINGNECYGHTVNNRDDIYFDKNDIEEIVTKANTVETIIEQYVDELLQDYKAFKGIIEPLDGDETEALGGHIQRLLNEYEGNL